MSPASINMLGEKIGSIEVVEHLGSRDGSHMWKCVCADCGYITEKPTYVLRDMMCWTPPRECPYCRRIRRKTETDKEAEQRKQKLKGIIYLIRCAETDYYRIGYTRNLKKRLKDIQRHCPFRVKVVLKFKGGFFEEMAMHAMFEEYKLHGSWYEFDEETLKEVKNEFHKV